MKVLCVVIVVLNNMLEIVFLFCFIFDLGTGRVTLKVNHKMRAQT